jgi:hypothetical protein
MRINFKLTRALATVAREDLHRPHPFAHERVGFMSAGLAAAGDNLLILAREYHPVPDGQYLRDSSVGAMMGPDAIRRAMQLAHTFGVAIFHVHSHGGSGVPGFSGIDVRESTKFVPDFFKVAPQCVHGALVLSNDAAKGMIWLNGKEPHEFVTEFAEVGAPLRKWRAA